MKIDGLKIAVSGEELIGHYRARVERLNQLIENNQELIKEYSLEKAPDFIEKYNTELEMAMRSAKLYAERLKPEAEYLLSRAELKEIWEQLL